MHRFSGLAAAGLLIGGLALAGCSREVGGDGVAESPGPSRTTSTTTEAEQPQDPAVAGGCTAATTSMLTLQPASSGQPVLAIPQPAGWERNTTLDSQIVRGVIVNQSMRANDFTPNAVVTASQGPQGIDSEQKVIDAELTGLNQHGMTVETAEAGVVCGHASMRVGYTLEGRPVNAVIVGVRNGDTYYSAVVTMQTADPTNADYVRDMNTILGGFQVWF